MNTETMTNYQPTLNSIHAQAIRENSVLLKIQKNTNPSINTQGVENSKTNV